MTKREMLLRLELAVLCKQGIKACNDKDLPLSMAIMKKATPLLAELELLTDDKEWGNHASQGNLLLNLAESFMTPKNATPH